MNKLVPRQVRFSETLSTLLDSHGYTGNKKNFCSEIGIAASTLSQYTSGAISPTFGKLLLIAETLGVTLDFLVYGEEPPAGSNLIDQGPSIRYLYQGVEHMQTANDKRSLMFSRISQAIYNRIYDAAKEASVPEKVCEGLFSVAETMLIERCSKQVWIASTNFMFDMISLEDGSIPETSSDVAAGTFAQIVGENLRNNVRYRFLVSWRAPLKLYQKES